MKKEQKSKTGICSKQTIEEITRKKKRKQDNREKKNTKLLELLQQINNNF